MIIPLDDNTAQKDLMLMAPGKKEELDCDPLPEDVFTCSAYDKLFTNLEATQLELNLDDYVFVDCVEQPILKIVRINNAPVVLNENIDANGIGYIEDNDVVYISVVNYQENVVYNEPIAFNDGPGAVAYLDHQNKEIIWALDDTKSPLDEMTLVLTTQLYSETSELGVAYIKMKGQTPTPILSSWVSRYENTVLNIAILDYDATYTYSEPIVTGGTAVRTDNNIAWTLPDVTANTYHEISITATAPLMYESLPDASGGSVLNYTASDFTASITSVCGTRSSNLSAYKTIMGPNILTGDCEVQGITSATLTTGPYELFSQKVKYNRITTDISLTATHSVESIAPAGYCSAFMYWDEEPSWTYSHWLDVGINISYNSSTNILKVSHFGNWYTNDATSHSNSCSVSGCTPTGVECSITRVVLRTANYPNRLSWVQSNESKIIDWIHSTIGPINPTFVYV